MEVSTNREVRNCGCRETNLPPEDCFTIKSIVRDMELHERDWAAELLPAGYFCQPGVPWER